MTKYPQARKRWGQNYLQDPGVLDRMKRAIEPAADQQFLEIGPGTGALTRHLLPDCANLHAIEIDPRMGEYLDPIAAVNARFSWEVGDILEWSPRPDQQGLRMVGNIPYYITSPILIQAFDYRSFLKDAHFLMQKEVARRLVASPGSKEYGILSVYAQLFARTELLFTVGKQVFVPRPNVDSAFIRLNLQEGQSYAPEFETHLRNVVRTAFNQRRKTLRNSLKSLLPARVPESFSINLDLRPEQLLPPQFETLARELTIME